MLLDCMQVAEDDIVQVIWTNLELHVVQHWLTITKELEDSDQNNFRPALIWAYGIVIP